jgi:hypothetical protein
MSYQAVIRDAGNALVTSHAVGMRISILQGSVSGTVVYSETQTPTTNVNGLISIEIGGGTGFDVINWATGPYYIKTETDPTGSTSYTIIGTSQLLSVPYALYAKTANIHYIGENYGGGIVFYVYDNGRHGLIAATSDQSALVVWTCTDYQSTASNAVMDGINGGLANTERIIIQTLYANEGSYAAQLCANYQGGNYADWYLPSEYELNLLYQQKGVVGGFIGDYYWSSTEASSNSAWKLTFDVGYHLSNYKSTTAYVRAIRSF